MWIVTFAVESLTYFHSGVALVFFFLCWVFLLFFRAAGSLLLITERFADMVHLYICIVVQECISEVCYRLAPT